jgi:hypothetical protein
MPIDSILVSTAVLSAIAAFAAVVAWGGLHSSSPQRQPAPRARRRSF